MLVLALKLWHIRPEVLSPFSTLQPLYLVSQYILELVEKLYYPLYDIVVLDAKLPLDSTSFLWHDLIWHQTDTEFFMDSEKKLFSLFHNCFYFDYVF